MTHKNALWGADVVESHEPTITHDYVTAMVKGDSAKTTGLGNYTENVDYPGLDTRECGAHGCVLGKGATHADCLAKCTAAADCQLYVFAGASCSGAAGALCWLKEGVPAAVRGRSCRNSQVVDGVGPGHWAIKGGDAQAGNLKVGAWVRGGGGLAGRGGEGVGGRGGRERWVERGTEGEGEGCGEARGDRGGGRGRNGDLRRRARPYAPPSGGCGRVGARHERSVCCSRSRDAQHRTHKLVSNGERRALHETTRRRALGGASARLHLRLHRPVTHITAPL
jgi:hypothetical protein